MNTFPDPIRCETSCADLSPCWWGEDGLAECVSQRTGHELRDDNVRGLFGAGAKELGGVGVVDLAKGGNLQMWVVLM